jgi:hypothetical protein
VHLSTLSSEEPAALRQTFMFSSTMRVCFSTVMSGILPVRRSVGVSPETKTKFPARITGFNGMPSFFSTTTNFGAYNDITLRELATESFLSIGFINGRDIPERNMFDRASRLIAQITELPGSFIGRQVND